ncbi:MAG: histidine phosphatase family protein [Candidatus Limivicinus sp.]|jgi:putative nucleotidyltransferase with HDIG domain
MRRIYFIRHGMPDFPEAGHYCLGQTDMPMGNLGRLQCCILQRQFSNIKLEKVFTSPLSRAADTARYISQNPVRHDGLMEMYAGEWDGFCFRDIKEKWPELYERRGSDPNIPIPGAEDVIDGQRRFVSAVKDCLNASDGDIAIVAHSTVMQSFIAYILGTSPRQSRQYKLPYCSYTVADYDGSFHLVSLGTRSEAEMDEELCLRLMEASGVGERVIRHCGAVAVKAADISSELNKNGYELDGEKLKFAALLHDIARAGKNHPQKGAEWLRNLGYDELADIVAQHHDFSGREINEAAVLYIADKMVRETETVSIDERFRASAGKCKSPEAAAAHDRRYHNAIYIRDKINSICRGEIIK